MISSNGLPNLRTDRDTPPGREPRVVLASDRGPLTFVRNQDGLVPEPRPGSLVDVLRCGATTLGDSGDFAWVSTTTSELDVEARRDGLLERLWESSPLLADPVFIEPGEYRAYYEGAGVRMLWLAHHELWGELPESGGFDAAAFHAYESVNARPAERVAHWCGTRSVVVLHDYQLATAPLVLRRIAPRTAVAHFTHTSFAPLSSLGRLPAAVATRLVRGLLGADLLGFQRPAWAENFLSC